MYYFGSKILFTNLYLSNFTFYITINILVCGGELSVLQSVIWSQLTINIISLEVVRAGQTDYMLLERVGNFLKKWGFLYEGILEKNAMFIHQRIKKLGDSF